MSELRVAIRMIAPFFGLAVALQAVAILPEELGDFGMADWMAPGCQFRCKRASALAGPAQWRLRVAARCGLDHAVQRGRQAGIVGCQCVSSAALATDPA